MTIPSESAPASMTALASAAPAYPPYVYLASPSEDERVAGLIASELERRGVRLVVHVTEPGAPLFGEDDPALSGATGVLLVGGPGIAGDAWFERVQPYLPDRMFVVALDRASFRISWPAVAVWNFGSWRGDPDDPLLDAVAQDLRILLGTNAIQRSYSAHAVLVRAAGRPGSQRAASAVLLEALAYIPMEGGTGTVLLDLLARQHGSSGSDILSRIAAVPGNAAERRDADLRLELDTLVELAADCAGKVSAGSEVHLRHLLAAAVIADSPPVDDAVLAELGTDAAGLRGLLLDAVRTVRMSDSLQAWEELLAERLAGGFVPDLVDQTLPISLDRDDLGHGTWAAMFASLIADEATPMPVSIGLFGEWGAGKSTFMGLLRGEIARLCGQPGYVRDVVQIGFNAWHYADANLWASLGDEIFPALMRTLTPPDDAQESVKQRATELRDEISHGLVAARELEGHVQQAQRQTQRLAAEVHKAQEDQVVAWRLLLGAALKSSLLRSQLDKAWRRLGIRDQVTQGEMFAEQLDGIRQDRRALRGLLGQRTTWAMAVACAAALLVTLAGEVIPVSWAAQLRDSGAITTITLVLGSGLTLARRAGEGMAALRSAAAQAARDKTRRSRRRVTSSGTPRPGSRPPRLNCGRPAPGSRNYSESSLAWRRASGSTHSWPSGPRAPTTPGNSASSPPSGRTSST